MKTVSVLKTDVDAMWLRVTRELRGNLNRASCPQATPPLGGQTCPAQHDVQDQGVLYQVLAVLLQPAGVEGPKEHINTRILHPVQGSANGEHGKADSEIVFRLFFWPDARVAANLRVWGLHTKGCGLSILMPTGSKSLPTNS